MCNKLVLVIIDDGVQMLGDKFINVEFKVSFSFLVRL